MRFYRTLWMAGAAAAALLSGASPALAESDEEDSGPPGCVEETSGGQVRLNTGACVGTVRAALHELSDCNVALQPASRSPSGGPSGTDVPVAPCGDETGY